MSSAFGVAIIGAFQGSLSVLLTISYGVVAANIGMIGRTTIKDVSTLCANIFLPALLITSIGKSISSENVSDYVPIFVWSIIYTLTSMVWGKLIVRWWGLPSWTVAAVTFNNTTSLPILLTESFASTGILSSIAGGDPYGAVERAKSYFLINSLVAKTATFALGPHLFDKDSFNSPRNPVSMNHSVKPSQTTALLPSHQSPDSSPRLCLTKRMLLAFTPTTWGAIIAMTIGLSPQLHCLFFAPPQEGGYLSVWISGSLRNIGELFTVLQVFIVGANLSKSFHIDLEGESLNPPIRAIVAIFAIRFVLWSTISIPIVYYLAVGTRILPEDPLIWWCMILIPIGPPAMILSTLMEVVNVKQREKLIVARTLAFMYSITPVISFAVVAALKVCEVVLKKKGEI